MKEYHALRSGMVVDRLGGVIYEPVEGVKGAHIAAILNEYHARGLFPDWCAVAHELYKRGQIDDVGLCDEGTVEPI